MTDKFSGVPVDADTRILAQAIVRIGAVEALYQKWQWDGNDGESLIFQDLDVHGKGDEDLQGLAGQAGKAGPNAIFSIRRLDSGYTFVNWTTEED